MTGTIAITVQVCLPRQHETRQMHCPAGLTAAAFLRMVCDDMWQNTDVLLVSNGHVILANEILQDGMTLEILPMVDGG